MSQNGPEKPNPPPTTRRIIKGPAATGRPTATGTHAAAPTKTGASTVVKKSGDPPSTRVKAHTQKHPPVKPEDLHGEVEVVSSGAEEDATRVRSRVRGDHEGGPAPRGLGLRQKIMIAMASVTIVTSILIFVVVYVKAVGQLSDEIDSKGYAMARLLQSVDPEVWLAAMHEDDAVRYERLTNLMKGFDDSWSESAAQQFFQANPAFKDEHESLYRGGLGEGRRKTAIEFFRRMIEKRKERWPAAQQRAIDDAFKACTSNAEWLRGLNMLVDPFGEVKPLRAGTCGKCKKHVAGADKCPACASPVTPYALASGEVVQMSVVDVTRGEGDASVAAGEAGKITRSGNRDVGGGFKVADGYVTDTRVPIRQYQLDQGPIETRAGPVKLRYFVLLSLTKIEDARSSLVWTIFLPILLAVCVGLAIAWWISERISEPVRILMDDINAVSAGDLDHKTQSHSSDEIGQLAVTFNRMTQALKAAHNQELEAKALEHELNIASEIQANLVPKKMLKLPGYDISAYYRPSKEVGGDYYDFIEIDDQHNGIIVADVSGKGVPGSLVMSMARAFIRMEAERTRNNSPSSTLKHANRMLAADIKKGMFVTAMYCILNRESGELAISSAGHNPMVLWRAATGEIELINPKGIALGFDKGPVFERTVAEEKTQLQVGDRIVLYTDGTVEAMNERNEEYGDKRFFGLVQQLATRDSNQFLNLVVKSLDEHKGSAPQHDDMTIVTLRYTGGGAQG